VSICHLFSPFITRSNPPSFFSRRASNASLPSSGFWSKLKPGGGKNLKDAEMRQQQQQMSLSRQRLLTLVYGDMEKANNFFPRTGFLPRFVVHGCTRLAVKLDFIAGLLLKAVEAAGTKDYRGVQANVGEVIAWRNLFWALSDAMVRDPKPWIGDYLLPNMDPGNAYAIIATMAYTRIKYIIEQTVASGLIYLNSHASDFKNPEIRPYLDRYLRGSNGYKAEERVKLLKLLWDCLATEFGGRHELYEINYGGSTEEIRRYCLFGAQASGNADRFKGFAEECMAEYDLDGWKVPDLTDPGELSYHMLRGKGRS